MPSVYLCPYHSKLHNAAILHPDPEHAVAKAYARAIHQPESWPYDLGDDPSFFAASHLKGPVTWGVCRGDVRNQLLVGDMVLFFAYDDWAKSTTYRLSAIATVDQIIRQDTIFSDPKLSRFREYLNLLTVPITGRDIGWLHKEPCFTKGGHDNWLWRLADRSVFRSTDFGKRQESIARSERFGTKAFKFGCNYVIFSTARNATYVVQRPPVVAEYHGGDEETWKPDLFSRGVRERTLLVAAEYGTKRRGLRLAKAYPHCPPVSWEMAAKELTKWRAELISFVRQCSPRPTKRSRHSAFVTGRGTRPC